MTKSSRLAEEGVGGCWEEGDRGCAIAPPVQSIDCF